MNEQIDTATRIMDVAQDLMQIQGYNAFSYADIAAQVGIKKASIHYYFPSKSDLAREVVARYRAAVRAGLAAIDRTTPDPRRKLEQFAIVYAEMLTHGNHICLCGMLAAELPGLPQDVQAEVQGFFSEAESWLARTLQEGAEAGVIQITGTVEAEARLWMASLEGALLIARSFGDIERIRAVAQCLLDKITKES